MGPGSSLRKPQTQQAAKRKPENPNLLPDGRIKCIHCGRGFAADRIDKHQAVCSSLNNIKFTKPGETVRKQTTYGVKGAVGYVDRATSDFSGKKIAGTPQYKAPSAVPKQQNTQYSGTEYYEPSSTKVSETPSVA